MTDRATPDELDRRAQRSTGWRRSILARLAKEAREYRPEVVETTTSYRHITTGASNG